MHHRSAPSEQEGFGLWQYPRRDHRWTQAGPEQQEKFMCGITGFLDPDGLFTEVDLKRMNACLLRRGPDGDGYFFSAGEVGLAMRRLAIIDIAGGWQPVYNEDRSVVVVFNGEIYNFQALRRELEACGHSFRTHSDSEVIAHLYERHGDDFPSKLRGMFAIALWDARQRRLVLARDRLGIKPLFVSRVGNSIVFGSEIKAVLACGKVERQIDVTAVDQYFTYTYIPAPRTIFTGIQKFPPAHLAIYTLDGNSRVSRYWSLPPQSSGDELNLEGSPEQAVERALLEAVESHMVSDVPVGAFLSGGIDSSLIVAMMSRYSSSPVQTFTVGFEDASGAFIDERVYAREMAKRYNLAHEEIVVRADAAAILPDVISAFDEPFADDSVIPSYYVSQQTARSVKVAMTGLGGDELFAGYKRHLGAHLSRHFRRLPKGIRSWLGDTVIPRVPEIARLGDYIDHLKRFSRAGTREPAIQYQEYLATLPTHERINLYSREFASEVDFGAAQATAVTPYREAAAESELERALRTDLALYLPDDILALSDRLSMWHSLELRVPFLDHPLVELSSRLASRHKISGLTQKKILRTIARRWIPESILSHRKQGFEAPMGAWMRGPLLPLLDEATSPVALDELRIFDPSTVRRLRDEHVNGVRKNSKVLFCLLVFSHWAKLNGVSR